MVEIDAATGIVCIQLVIVAVLSIRNVGKKQIADKCNTHSIAADMESGDLLIQFQDNVGRK